MKGKIFEPRLTYKPFEYEWAYEDYVKHEQAHWIVQEVTFADDLAQWNGGGRHKDSNLTEKEKHMIINILRFFTQAELVVLDNYNSNLVKYFPKPEIVMMLGSFASRENVHIDAYSTLNDSLGLPDSDYSEFLKVESMKKKYDIMTDDFNVKSEYDLARNLCVFGGFIEGISLFSSFAFLANFPRQGKLISTGQVIAWSAIDEAMHSKSICKLANEVIKTLSTKEKNALAEQLREDCKTIVKAEDSFVNYCFGDIDRKEKIAGISITDLNRFIRNLSIDRLNQIDLDINKPYYKKECSIDNWFWGFVNGRNHTNFFEQRATDYSKGAVIWEDDWYVGKGL